MLVNILMRRYIFHAKINKACVLGKMLQNEQLLATR
jgi:hypothetical protein